MRRMLRPMLRGAVVAVGLLGCVSAAQAQGIQLRLLEERTDGAVYELTASWPTSLRAALDSIDAVHLDELTALSLSRGGLFERSETVRLPSLAQPRVRVLASDYDEVRLPAAAEDTMLIRTLNQGPADVLGLGLERKRPAATLLTRLLTYDEAEGTLRRYRRMVVAVDYAARRAGQPLTQAALISSLDNPHLDVSQSVLADGTVFKLAVREEGVYRIDRAFLGSLPGFDLSVDGIDPNNVKVYGNGGAPVPALNSAPRLADLAENQVFVQGGGDGAFNEGDAVWFYAAGPTGWQSVIQRDFEGDPIRDDQGNLIRHWEHYVHPFSNDNYYFIKIDQTASSEPEQVSFLNDPSAVPLTQVAGRHVVDMDDFLWAREAGGTGHTWVSNLIALGGGTLPILENTTLPGLLDGTVTYRGRAAVQSNPAASVSFLSGALVLASRNFGPVTNSPTNTVARSGVVEFDQVVSAGQALNIDLQLESRPGSPKAALDWLRVFYPKALRAENGQVRFHTPIGQTGVFEMTLTGFGSAPFVWDVTEPGAFRRLDVQAAGNAYRVQVAVDDLEQPRELIAFAPVDMPTLNVEEACPAETGCRVTPQNLHGIQSFPTFVIVTPEIFRPYAEELADMRRQEGLVVEVVDVQKIYNEFSGGLTDIRGIRDYFKFLYDRAPSEDQMLRYALFFGDGHYNYRELGEPPEFPNWIPPYETEESWNPEVSFTTDDYFGLLDDDEGIWPYTRETFLGPNEHLNERIDLGIGRFTVQTEAEAQVFLKKIKHYESPETYGSWRTRYLFLADDGPTGLAGVQDDKDLHTQNIDVVAEIVDLEAPEIDQKKVYAISYTREFRNGWRVPGARQDLLSAIRDGVLVVNYSGHGGEFGLAQEDIFNIEDARTLQNFDTLPIFITATCSFGRWDLADEQSGAEELLLNPNGGAIALLTTVRTVYTSGNETTLNVGLNVALNAELFRKDEAGLPRRLGDVVRLTKNTRVGFEGNNRKFNLLGDPTMRLGVPSHKVVVNSINDTPLSEQTAPLRALEHITVSGEAQTPDGTFDASFNGVVNVTIFDAERQVAIPDDIRRHMRQPYYLVREDLIWRGKINATNGRFNATFVVPKDISYSNKPGRITVYGASASLHAQGFTENLIVGGTAANPPDDSKGPEIELFLNDETFVDGGLTPPRPQLIVKLFDDSGINTVGAGVGHEMLLVLDDDEQNALDIGDLYESEENSFQRGRVTFEFEEELTPGPHTLSVRAWDVLNNSGASTLDFVVSEAEALQVRNVFNYPNPTTGPTRFVFEHNQSVGTPVKVQIRIYSLAGRPIRTIEQDEILPGGPMQIVWDGTDDDLDRLVPGVYLYKVRVEVEGVDGERQVSETIEKLAVVR